jgi:hypothetical protein
MDIAGNWIFIFLINFFVKYSTFAAPELFTFKKNRLEEDFCVFRNGLISISD